MKINKFFPTSIAFIEKIEEVGLIRPICNRVLNNLIKEKKGYITSKDNIKFNKNIADHWVGEKDNIIVNPLKKSLLEFMDYLGYEIPLNPKYKFYVSQLEDKSSLPPTNHPDALISGVCFLHCDDYSSPIIIEDPREIKTYSNYKNSKNTTIDNLKELYLYPKPGNIWMWESWLKYRIDNNIGFNLKMLYFHLLK